MPLNQTVRGVLRFDSRAFSMQDQTVISNTLDLVKISTVDWQARVRAETINHVAMYRQESSPGQDIDRLLVEDVWKHVRNWTARRLGYNIQASCPVTIAGKAQMEAVASGALGLFCVFRDGSCQIMIRQDIVGDMNYLLVVLAHEYIHYMHYSIADATDYSRCPVILSEGLAEVGARAFYAASNYPLPAHMRKSWNPSYELGRRIVEQIASEGFGLHGFVRGFITNVAQDCTWKKLDRIFSQ